MRPGILRCKTKTYEISMSWNEVMISLIIVIAKIIEVTVGTLRIVMITKGERKMGSIFAFVEVVLWCILAGSVLSSITEAPLRTVAYSIGFAIGNYVGSYLEEKIAIGLSEIQVILMEEHSAKVCEALRNAGYAVTQIKAQGKNHPRELLMMYVPRTKIKPCVATIREIQENAVITISDTKPVYGGFGLLRK